MRSIYRYKDYYKDAIDCNDVLLVGSKRVERLLENIFSSLNKVLSSKTVNIGMDEPCMLGRGKYLDLHGYVSPDKLFLAQLKTTVKIAEKYNFKIKMWADFYSSDYKEKDEILKFAKEKNIQIVFWDYGNAIDAKSSPNEIAERFSKEFDNYDKTDTQYAFACSDMKFLGLTTHNAYALKEIEASLSVAEKHKVKSIWLTSWGDCGAETSVFSALPVIALCGFIKNIDVARYRFSEYFNLFFGNFQCFMDLDLANRLTYDNKTGWNTSSKYYLYQDVFCGVMDNTAKPEYREIYSNHIKTLKKDAEKVDKRYRYLFDTQINLLKVLKNKYIIGNTTRGLYSKKNIKGLKTLIKTYNVIIKDIESFYDAFRFQWFKDNKTFGFEIHEARIGALLLRIKSCKTRLKKYINGSISEIEELNQTILDLFDAGEDLIMLNWGELISPGMIIEYMSFV